MANIGHQLMIKYGLGSAPSQALADLWLSRVQALKASGHNDEEAGRLAAKQTFSDYETHKYASVADDIESLLDAAKRRD